MGVQRNKLDHTFEQYYNIVRNRSLYIKVINDILNMSDMDYKKISDKYALSPRGFSVLLAQYKYRELWDREFKHKPKDLVFDKNNILKTTSFLKQIAITDYIHFYGLEETYNVYNEYEEGVLTLIKKNKCWHLANCLSKVFNKIK